MARFRLEFPTPLAPDVLFARVLDLSAHDRLIPLTRVTGGPMGQGATFTARTGVGRFAFDDPMRVVRFAPPGPDTRGEAVLCKEGRAITGEIRIRVRPLPSGAGLLWEQEITIPALPRLLDPVVGVVAALSYRVALELLWRRTS